MVVAVVVSLEEAIFTQKQIVEKNLQVKWGKAKQCSAQQVLQE